MTTTKKTQVGKGKKEKKSKKIKSPSPFSVLFIIIALMAGLTWIIPSGYYERVKDPDNSDKWNIVQDTYKEVEKVQKEDGKIVKDSRQGLWDAFVSPILGTKGIPADDNGNGKVDGKLDVIIFILILGGFLGVTMKTGALDAAIGGLLKKMKGREKWLIPILMTLFAIGGTTYGMQEEAVAFYALMVPIMLAAGYNAMTSVMVIVLGAGSGVLASTVNPFSTGIAANAAGIQLSNVLLPQAIILVLSLAASITFTMRYAAKVKAGHYKEDSVGKPAVKTLDMTSVPEFTRERKLIMSIFGLTFLVMVISLIPWEDFGVSFFKDFHNYLVSLPFAGAFFGFGHSVQFGSWYFNEISALFLISTVLITIVYYEKFKKEEVSVMDTFIAGVGDMFGVTLVIAVAAAISVIMTAGGIQDTIVHWGAQVLSSVPKQVVGVLTFIFYIPMSFIIPSSSGLATASMPIIAPVADLVGSSKEVVVVAFATASGVLNMIAPTIASLLAGLTLAGVSYKAWVKRVAPLMGILTFISIAVIFAMSLMR